jgi:hypothetical protein
MLIREFGFFARECVRTLVLPDATATDEHLGLKYLFTLPRFTLDVKDGVALLDIGIKSKNHGGSVLLIGFRDSSLYRTGAIFGSSL